VSVATRGCCCTYHPAVFERVVDSIKGVSIQGFFSKQAILFYRVYKAGDSFMCINAKKELFFWEGELVPF
jgi:hypothetical protein